MTLFQVSALCQAPGTKTRVGLGEDMVDVKIEVERCLMCALGKRKEQMNDQWIGFCF